MRIKLMRILMPSALLLLVMLTACRQTESSNTVRVSGHIEATEVQVAAEVGGRLVELRVAEGDRVAPGEVVARLDTRDVELQVGRARAERAAADAQLRLLQAGARPEEIRQAQAQTDAAAADVDSVIGMGQNKPFARRMSRQTPCQSAADMNPVSGVKPPMPSMIRSPRSRDETVIAGSFEARRRSS